MTSYTILQAAKLLRVSRRTIYNFIKQGKLQTINAGTSKRVTHDSLEKLRNPNAP